MSARPAPSMLGPITPPASARAGILGRVFTFANADGGLSSGNGPRAGALPHARRRTMRYYGFMRFPFPSLLAAALPVFLAVQPLAAKPHVGVYYYPWYAGKNWNQNGFLRGNTRMNIPPLIGTYDNVTDKTTVKQHIEWSTNFGIDTWICSWWGPDSYQGKAILNNVAPSMVGTNLTFCLFYETSTFYGDNWTFGATAVQLFYDHVKYMRDNFFSHPNYWKIGGKPVVVVYLSRQMQGDYVTALDRVRKDFNVFLIGDDFHFGPAEPERHKHWDAITIYNSHGLKTYDGYPQTTGFIEGAKQNFRNHKKALAGSTTLLMSNAIPGYNDRAQRLASNNYPIPRRMAADSGEGTTFDHMLQMAIPEGDSAVGTAICSWNEWWEDSEIEPSVVSPPTNKDGTTDFTYSKGYMYEGYGATLLKMVLDRAGRNAAVAPSLALSEPLPGNAWARGAKQTINWKHGGIIYYVKLEYQTTAGWTRIATQIENSGSYAWTVAADAALPVKVRVSTVEGVTWSTGDAAPVAAPGSAPATGPRIRALGRGYRFDGLAGITGVEVHDIAGHLTRRLSASADAVDWDGTDAAGRRLVPGVYVARFSGEERTFARPLAIRP